MRDDDRLGPVRVWSSALGSLVPWAALLVTVSLAEDELQVDVMPAFAVLCLAFVAVPSMVAILAGRSPVTRMAVALVMTGVAVFAGVQVTAIDDGLGRLRRGLRTDGCLPAGRRDQRRRGIPAALTANCSEGVRRRSRRSTARRR